jgi:hypothetical protein
MISKIRSSHTEKPAYIYIRQSTMAQVRHHQESTERQYALKEKAVQLARLSGFDVRFKFFHFVTYGYERGRDAAWGGKGL